MNEEAGGADFRRPSCLQIHLLRIIEPPEGSLYAGIFMDSILFILILTTSSREGEEESE